MSTVGRARHTSVLTTNIWLVVAGVRGGCRGWARPHAQGPEVRPVRRRRMQAGVTRCLGVWKWSLLAFPAVCPPTGPYQVHLADWSFQPGPSL